MYGNSHWKSSSFAAYEGWEATRSFGWYQPFITSIANPIDAAMASPLKPLEAEQESSGLFSDGFGAQTQWRNQRQ